MATGKEKRLKAQRDHAAELQLERERRQREKERREKREAKRAGKRVEKPSKRKLLRYRRHMRIGGVIVRNKGHAKKLFREKREREMEWERIPEERERSKKRRVETQDPDIQIQ